MPSLEKLTRLPPKVLRETLKLEPRQHYGPDESDNLVFMSPSVALKDEELRHGGPSNFEIGAKECLSIVTRKILETKDVSLFEVPEITATHLGYGKKAENKEGRRAITHEEGEHWLKMLDFTRFSHDLPESEDTNLSAEYIQGKLSGLKIEEQGRFLLFFSILLIYYEKNKKDERKATVGPNKISDFLIFWTLPYLLNFSHRKVQEILMHGKRECGEAYSVETVKISTEYVIKKACDQMADDQGKDLLNIFRKVLGKKPLEEEYELLADTAESPIIFVPMEYQVTNMPAHIKDLVSKTTWNNKFADANLLADFLKVFVDDSEIQRDFFHALSGLGDRQGIDYAIVLPDIKTYKDFVDVIKEENPDVFIEQPRSIHCQGIHVQRAVVKGSKTNYTVCFSYLPGSSNVLIAQLFRAIGSHYLNHFTVAILEGKICNSLDSYRCGDLHPVSKAMKFVKKHDKMVRVTKLKEEKRGTLVYPLQCVGGRGLFTEMDFPVTYLRWENEVKDDPVVREKGLAPQYRFDEPLPVGFFKKGISQTDKSLPLSGPGLAGTPEKLQAYTYRVVNLDGSVIAHIARSARKHGHAMIMALGGYCDKFQCSISSRPEILRTIICHFVRAIILAGLPSVYRTVPDSEDHEVEMGSESEEEEEEEEEDQRDSGYHTGATTSQGSPVEKAETPKIGSSADRRDREPTDQDLLLVQSVGNKYEELGMHLGVPREVLQDIKENTNLQTPSKKALEMLREWLNRDEDASCMKLADGLRIVNVGRNDLAKKLLEQL